MSLLPITAIIVAMYSKQVAAPDPRDLRIKELKLKFRINLGHHKENIDYCTGSSFIEDFLNGKSNSDSTLERVIFHPERAAESQKKYDILSKAYKELFNEEYVYNPEDTAKDPRGGYSANLKISAMWDELHKRTQ